MSSLNIAVAYVSAFLQFEEQNPFNKNYKIMQIFNAPFFTPGSGFAY